ncbi:MAG: hypothetical protein AAB538_03860 [Patescibacteria group bacterium]
MARKKKPLITSGAPRPVTARDPKGMQAISVVEAAYNELLLDDVAAQRVNERGDELRAVVLATFKKLSAPPPPPEPLLLTRMDTITVPAHPEPFKIRDHFVKNLAPDAAMKIAWVSEDFQRLFYGVEEPAIPEMKYAVDKLVKGSLDTPIIKELGGKEKATIMLGGFWGALKPQGRGQSGALRTDGYWNIGYVEVNGTLHAVGADWGSARGGWYVRVYSVTHPSEWDAGSQVVSRMVAAA